MARINSQKDVDLIETPVADEKFVYLIWRSGASTILIATKAWTLNPMRLAPRKTKAPVSTSPTRKKKVSIVMKQPGN